MGELALGLDTILEELETIHSRIINSPDSNGRYSEGIKSGRGRILRTISKTKNVIYEERNRLDEEFENQSLLGTTGVSW